MRETREFQVEISNISKRSLRLEIGRQDPIVVRWSIKSPANLISREITEYDTIACNQFYLLSNKSFHTFIYKHDQIDLKSSTKK